MENTWTRLNLTSVQFLIETFCWQEQEYKTVFLLSVNQVRIRDTVEENENMFEIHRLENLKIMSGEVPLTDLKYPANLRFM